MPEKTVAWKEQAEVPTSITGIRILLFVYAVLGRRVARWLTVAVLLVCYPFLRAARRASADFRTRWELYTGRRFPGGGVRHLCHFCFVLLDRLACFCGRFPSGNITVCTPDVVERVTREFRGGRGCFMVVSHLGNVELLRAVFLPVAQRIGRSIHVYLDVTHSPRFNSFLQGLSKEGGMCFHSTLELGNVGGAIALAEFLENGDVVVMAGDRVSRTGGRASTTHDFLGRPAQFPLGVFRMAAALGCPVYCVFLLAAGMRYDLHAVPMSGGDVPAAELCRSFVKHLEDFCESYPLDWYNFYPFWS